MELEYVPLLRTQRELYDLPRGGERFREYLRRMIDARTGDLRLPLVALNPMGKPHVAECLDALLALDAAALARTATVLTPLREHDDRPTVIAALFGDEAALRLGYPPLGLARDAGLAWALARAAASAP